MRVGRRGIVGASLVSFLLTSSGVARADEWYGHKTLAADGAALTLLFGSFALPKKAGTPVRLLALATYLVASPVIHATEERGGVGAGALGVRLGAPLLLGFIGGGIGAAASTNRGFLDGMGAVLLGGLVGVGLGVLTAITLDAAVFARSPAKVGTVTGGFTLPPAPGLYVPFGGAF